MDREVPQIKPVAETERVEVLRNRPEVLEVMVNRDGQLGP